MIGQNGKNAMFPYLGKLVDIKDIGPEIKLFGIELINGGGECFADCKPGQFAFVSAFGVGEAPFGIASTPQRSNKLEFAVQRLGSVTTELHQLGEGDIVGVRGPLGNFFPMDEFKGKNLEDAILHAEHKLKLVRTEFNYEVVTEKTRLFGISKEVVIRAVPKAAAPENAAADFLDKLLKVFPLELTYRVQNRGGILFVVFEGPDKQLLLWKDGQLLLALQHVLNKISGEKVQVDCEFYRKRKEKKIREYALEVAGHVRQSGRSEITDLMNPYERRIVHIAVNQVPGMTSESLGDGFLKRIKIFAAGRNGRRTPPRESGD